MVTIFIILLLILLLAGSWFIFIRFYHRYRSRERAAVQRFEENRKQLQEQNAVIDSFADLLIGIHEIGTENPMAETKMALARIILESALRIMGCSVGTLMVLDKETNELIALAAKGTGERAVPLRMKMGEGIAGMAAESGKTIVVNNIDTDARFLNRTNLEYHLKSLISIPLKIKKRWSGY